MDDYCPRRRLSGEHGLSLYIETGGKAILFDAGQDSAFMDNAEALGVAIDSVSAVVLSHGHYDHGGGLSALYERLAPDRPPLYAGAGYAATRLSRTGSLVTDIGLPSAFKSAPVVVVSATPVCAGLRIMPASERLDHTEANPRFRKLDGGTESLDEFEDELSLVAEDGQGLVIITGCAHRGIVNIVESARAAFPGRRVRAVVGGFHLVDADDKELARVAGYFSTTAPDAVYCSHCTGPRGFSALSNALPGKVSWLACGERISL